MNAPWRGERRVVIYLQFRCRPVSSRDGAGNREHQIATSDARRAVEDGACGGRERNDMRLAVLRARAFQLNFAAVNFGPAELSNFVSACAGQGEKLKRGTIRPAHARGGIRYLDQFGVG